MNMMDGPNWRRGKRRRGGRGEGGKTRQKILRPGPEVERTDGPTLQLRRKMEGILTKKGREMAPLLFPPPFLCRLRHTERENEENDCLLMTSVSEGIGKNGKRCPPIPTNTSHANVASV